MNEEEIFHQALARSLPEERAAYLEQACAGNAALRASVEALLRAHSGASGFLARPTSSLLATIDEPIREGPGTVIGPYKLLEQIGEGGFGIVFLAEQMQLLRRKVALKVLKPGMDTRQVVARFEAERQALALMDHPNIARVFDAGATDSGRPYFVMELVRGIPITQLCDDNRLTLRERLELFVAVCQAVQHAHQKGIIHRDLKPSNVLVTLQDDGTPLVKVIDFGIAKALGQERLTDKTLFTGFAHMIGTPLYMSPEQAEMGGQDADTRTDIYALGVLLYELLTATTPFDKERLKEASYDEIRRIIREEEPAKPSTRISTLGQAATTVSANRKSEPRRLSQLFRGELDWMVMKALEKDRNRRYDTASSFAADVQRYLDDEPVQACPPSAGYCFRKFARRHKAALMTAAVVAFAVLLVVAGLTVSTVLVWQANQELRQNLYYQRIALAEREWSANNLSRVEQLLEECPADLRGWEWHYLKRLRLEGIPPLRHDAAVFSAAFNPDDRWIASGSQDGMVTVWDATTGQKRYAFAAHKRHVRSVVFSPDGQRLATASWDGTAKVWDFDPQRTGGGKILPLLTLTAHHAPVSSVAFSPDGKHLASAGDDKTVRVWDVASGNQILELNGHTSLIWCVAYCPNGHYLASASDDTTVRIWDARTGDKLFTLQHSAPVLSASFSRDGQWLASACADMITKADGEVKVWSARTGRETLTLRGHVAVVFSVMFSPNSQRLASAGHDGTVKLWDLTTGQEAISLRGNPGQVRSVAFSHDGNRLVAARQDRTVHVWNATPLEEGEKQELVTLRGHVGGIRSVAFSPDGHHLASTGYDATLRFWDFKRALRGTTSPPTRILPCRKSMVDNLAFSKDGRLLACGGEGGHRRSEIDVWDATTLTHLDTIRNVSTPLAFSPDGRYLATEAGQVGTDVPIRILDAATRRDIRTLKGHGWMLTALAFSPDPGFARLASASVDSTVQIWDTNTGEPVVDPLRHMDAVNSVAFSPDGRYLASGSLDRTVKVWDAKTWKLLHDLPDSTGGVLSVAFYPKDDRVLAWGSTDGTVKIVKFLSGLTREIRTLRGHTSWVESVAFSPDGEWLASGSLDGMIKLWEVPSFVPEPPSPADRASGLDPNG